MRLPLALSLVLALCGALLLECGSPSENRSGFGANDAGAGGTTLDVSIPDAGEGADTTADDAGGSFVHGDGGSVRPPVDAGLDAQCEGGDDVCVSRIGCGNGVIDPGLAEVCDDGNNVSGDGCSADCKTVEKDYACPQPGKPCVYLVVCGDGKIGGKETCDDGNVMGGDGCSATCQLEPGWACEVGGPCAPAKCGDGVVVGNEVCDDGNGVSGDGCSATCQLESGFQCGPDPMNPTGPQKCSPTTCGNGVREGTEGCDDGNTLPFDGCSRTCQYEPVCPVGMPCTSRCGDGFRLPSDVSEQCDDGNNKPGDGCSPTCQIEAGYQCMDVVTQPGATLTADVIYRDFISLPLAGAIRHPDFEIPYPDPNLEPDFETPGLVAATLGADGLPIYAGICDDASVVAAQCPQGRQLSTKANYDQWYRNAPGVNLTSVGQLTLGLAGTTYTFASTTYYPLDGQGWVAAGKEGTAADDPAGGAHNFGFTDHLRYWFAYQGGESLSFYGDDDVWVFINGHLVVDLGGLHPQRLGAVTLDAATNAGRGLGLQVGQVFEVDLFHAERHTFNSNYELTIGGFASSRSVCKPVCGDGVVTPGEGCDLGAAKNTGAYNGCTTDCRRGPYCGDAIVQAANEQCDDGVNLTLYGAQGVPGCAPGCVLSDYCGDGKLDSVFGEQCDLGKSMNTGAYNGCTSACRLGPRCGDGIVQSGEQCDDGNTVSGDGCANDCTVEVPR